MPRDVSQCDTTGRKCGDCRAVSDKLWPSTNLKSDKGWYCMECWNKYSEKNQTAPAPQGEKRRNAGKDEKKEFNCATCGPNKSHNTAECRGKPEKQRFICNECGPNNSHNSNQCRKKLAALADVADSKGTKDNAHTGAVQKKQGR